MSYMDVSYSEEKFTELVLHISRIVSRTTGQASNQARQGAVPRRVHAAPATHGWSPGAGQKLTHGPTPCQLASVRSGLVASGERATARRGLPWRPQQRLIPKRQADLSLFTADELRTIDDVLSQLAGMSGTQLSELAAQEPGWRLSEVGETIPFSTAFLDFPQVSTPTSRRLSESVAERYRFVAAG